MRRFELLVVCIGQFTLASLAAEEPHPWRPPFGLDRVGQTAKHDDFEADAAAYPDQTVNPVDLGTVLVPHHWLLLDPEQRTKVRLAALAHTETLDNAVVRAWFSSSPHHATIVRTNFVKGVRSALELLLSTPETRLAKDTLEVAIVHGDRERWHKTIAVMVVQQRPALPQFGAVELKLRYDLPITVNSGQGGKLGTLSWLDYDMAWDPQLHDVVVALPNGSRWVFWRGSSYIPFWAAEHNTGLCYEWAETTPPPDGVDCVEPLMDKELRYGRAQIIESTAARVQVRWTYQSTDFNYKVWGDQASEDYFFYPDGFGTRVLTLQRRPQADYELSEFIILSPPGAYPLDIVPTNAVELLYLEGGKSVLTFPPGPDGPYSPAKHRRNSPVVYCIRAHRDDRARAIYFHPSPAHYPALQFAPFRDAGQLVTPAYWGSHWPLSRGKSTGAAIDDRIGLSPAHNSLLTWAMGNRPPPLSRAEVRGLDSLGRSKDLLIERWAWLIGMTDAPDADLLDWARSFSVPPSIQLEGATLDFPSYAPERRAMRLNVSGKSLRVSLQPEPVTVNPVFELARAPKELSSVQLDDRTLPASAYAWDGRTMWIEAKVTKPTVLHIQFR